MSDTREIARQIYEANDGADCDFCGALCPDDAAKLIDAIDEALRNERERQWQPIETAPKDGTQMLLVWHWDSGLHTGVSIVCGRWFCHRHAHSSRHHDCPNEKDCDMGWSNFAGTMSHWMPIPELPAAIRNDKGDGTDGK